MKIPIKIALNRRKVVISMTAIAVGACTNKINNNEIELKMKTFQYEDFDREVREFRESSDILIQKIKKISRNRIQKNHFLMPCTILDKSGILHEHVFLYDVRTYLESWLSWPESNHEILADNILRIEKPSKALPAQISQKIYANGEAGMGYFSFTLITKNGEEYPVLSGDLVDFIALPEHVNVLDIVDVKFDTPSKTKEHLLRNLPYKYCLILMP